MSGEKNAVIMQDVKEKVRYRLEGRSFNWSIAVSNIEIDRMSLHTLSRPSSIRPTTGLVLSWLMMLNFASRKGSTGN
jgi:hypothetical protein